MRRIVLFLITRATPPSEREWVVGDTLEEFDRVERSAGAGAARRWLLGELWRVLLHAPRHRRAVRRASPGLPRPRGDGAMSGLGRDFRYALRVLGRAPGFTAMAVLTLALGIGANTAIFAVVHAVLLKPLPFADADRLMLVHLRVSEREAARAGAREVVWSYPKYRTFLELQQVFDETALFAGRDLDLTGDGEPERVRGEVVTDRYPVLLGITPSLGRSFTPDEGRREASQAVALIGDGLWRRRFGADPGTVGRIIQLNAAPYTIVGVLPRGFRGLNGDADVWVPLAALEPSEMTDEARFSHSYRLVARRKPHVTEQEAITAAPVLGEQIDRAFPDAEPWGATAASLDASRVDADLRRASLILLGAVGFVLLIACVNLTNLALAKAVARRRDVAVRMAIGASRGRIVRQFLAEGVLLAFFGALGGAVIASGLLNSAAVLLPASDVFFRTPMAPGVPRIAGAAGLTRIGASMIDLDAATLLFTGGIACVTAILVSLAPAWQGSALRPIEVLKAGTGSGSAAGLDMLGLRGALVIAQIALAVLLLTGAALMVKSAARLQATAIGVRPERVVTVRVDLPRATYTAERGTAFQSQLTERVRAISGADSAGLGNCPPVSGGCNSTSIWFPPAARSGGGRDRLVGVHWASPEYFATLGIHVRDGRTFSERDRTGQPKVAVVNEAAARRFWPGDSPVGKRIAVGQGGFHDGAEVVGVVSDVRFRTIETAPEPDVFLPLAQSYQPRVRLFVRSRLDTEALVTAIAREIHALDPNLPLSEIKTMEERVGDAMWRTRIGAWLLSAFAALALLLTAVGIFAVMTQTVSQRTPEIGLRMALGAQPRDVLRLVLRRAAVLTTIGLAAGTAAALALTRFVASLLYGVQPHDPATFAAVALLLTIVALAACYLPARRATRLDAVVALRAE